MPRKANSLVAGFLIWILVGVAGISLSPLPAQAQQPGDDNDLQVIFFDINSGRLAFIYQKTADVADLYVLDFYDLSVKPVVVDKGKNEAPSWSPDGRRILFASDRSGDSEIYSIASDGTDLVQLTSSPGTDTNPSYSPDGKKIVFQSNRGTPESDIYIMDADGKNPKILSTTKRKNIAPRWNPRGQEILYVTNVEWPGWDIIIHNLTDNTSKVYTRGLGSYTRPAWHPYGGQYAFSFGTTDEFDICMASKGQSVPTCPIARPGRDLDPSYDDDGRVIFFSGESAAGVGDFQLYAYSHKFAKKDGEKTGKVPDSLTPQSNVRIVQLLKSKKAARQPAWTPLPDLVSLSRQLKVKAEQGEKAGPRPPGAVPGPGGVQ